MVGTQTILKEIRESCKLTTTELSKRSGVHRRDIYNLEQGKRNKHYHKVLDVLAQKVDLAYIAGLVDRASTITITKQMPAEYNCHQDPHYLAKFTLGSVHKEIPEIIMRILDTGKVSPRKTPNGGVYYSYYAHCAQSYAAIFKLLPYLKIRRAKAQVLLNFRTYMDECPYGKHRKLDYDRESHLAKCEWFYQEIRRV